jgi:hypothetical protein
MTSPPETSNAEQYRSTVLGELTAQYGYVISARELPRILGFKSYDAFKQCVLKGDLELTLFYIPGRRARHAMTVDVVDWLATQWQQSRHHTNHPPTTKGRRDMPTG